MEPVAVTADAAEFTCNVYLVPGERTALVDAGSMPGVVDAVREHVERVDLVALTHQHSDHVAQLDAVVEAFDPDVAAYGPHEHRTIELDDGDTLQLGDDDYEVVYTPGHASDHVAFVGETRLFSGDVAVYNDGAFDDGSFGRTDLAGQSRERLVESLRNLVDRVPDTVESMYAGHGDVFRAAEHDDSVQDVLARALERAERREPKYPE